MDKKTTGWVAYISWIGFIIAICTGDKKGASFHLNQALVCLGTSTIALLISCIPLTIFQVLGGLLSLFTFVCWVLGLIAAINEEEKEVPLLGKIKILNFNSDNGSNDGSNNVSNN